MPTPILSIVAPFHNEADVLPEFHRRLAAVLDDIAVSAEIVFVDDGSTDGSLRALEQIRRHDTRVGVVKLSRNFGKEIAVTAGLDLARGEAVVVIDSDLQDPPELIAEMMAKWREGFDVVYAERAERLGETWLKKASARTFYNLMQHIGEVPIPRDTGDFRLLSRRCVEALRDCRERQRFMKGLFTWIGFAQTKVVYNRDARYAGTSKWNYWRLWNLALEGITSSTTLPLKIATYLGLLVALGALLYSFVFLVKTLAFGIDVPGYPSLLIATLFLGSVQLIALGIIGEYVGRIFMEAKGRPLYLLDFFARPGVPGAADRAGYQRRAAVWTGASQSPVSSGSSAVKVTEQPAMSSEVQ